MTYTNPNLEDFNNLDGEVQNLEVINGSSNIRNNINEDFGNDFDNEENMSFFEGDDDFYNAKGSKKSKKRNRYSGTMFDKDERARRRTLREDTKAQRQTRRDKQTQSRTDARSGKTQAKLSQAETQKTVASQLGVETESDKALATALAKGSEQTPNKPGMSTGAKVGIAVGILALLGVIGFVVVKKMKSNK
jgi:cobalamin biosynthesis Mg chelatase CobN